MKLRFLQFLITASLMACPALGQPASQAWLQPGASILANPMGLPDSYYPAQVVRYNADSGTYLIRFTSGPYAVGKGEYVLSASKLQPAPAQPAPLRPVTNSAPPAANNGNGLEPGSTVMANPMNFPNDFHPAQILSYNAAAGTYRVRFTDGPYAVGKGEYQLSASKLRPAASAAAQQSTPAPAPGGQTAKNPPTSMATATNPPATKPPTRLPAATTVKKEYETTWDRIWREREAAIAAQQQQASQPAGRVSGSYPFQGLYLRHEQSFQGTALNYREDHYYFFSDGRVYHDVPPEGPARFDWNKAQQETPELCGYYGVNGNEITFSWPGGGYTWILKKSGGGYEMNYSPTVKVEAFPANARLSGTYERGDITMAAGAPTLSTAFSYTFSPDGTVILNDMKGTDSTNLTTTVRDQDRGTYMISGNNMEIRTGAGVWRFTAYPQWNNGTASQTPARISLDGALLERRR